MTVFVTNHNPLLLNKNRIFFKNEPVDGSFRVVRGELSTGSLHALVRSCA